MSTNKYRYSYQVLHNGFAIDVLKACGNGQPRESIYFAQGEEATELIADIRKAESQEEVQHVLSMFDAGQSQPKAS